MDGYEDAFKEVVSDMIVMINVVVYVCRMPSSSDPPPLLGPIGKH